MVTGRRTRATSVAATQAAEPPSRRTRAASVSANKGPQREVKKAVPTPKRKRSASAASRSVGRPAAAEASTPARRDSGRQKKRKTDDEEVAEPRGRKLEREAKDQISFDLEQHRQRKGSFVEEARKAIAEDRMNKERKAELQRVHQGLVSAEKDLAGTEGADGVLTEIGWRLEGERTVEERNAERDAAERIPPVSRLRGAYWDTTAQGYVKAPLSARAHRTQQKHIFDEKEKAEKMIEDLKAKFVEGLEFSKDGSTNIPMVDGYHEMRFKLASVEEQFANLKDERQDIEKVKAFTAELEGILESFKGIAKVNIAASKEDTKINLEKAPEGGSVDRFVQEDEPMVEKKMAAVSAEDEVEKVAGAPSTAKKSTEERPKKTPRRKSIRMGALSTFTPSGTRSNSEAAEDVAPSSPLSPPPAVLDSAAKQTPATSSLRAPESISWATPVSEIHDFLLASSDAATKNNGNITFDARPIGFKCPGHKREWRGAEQTKDLIIYRDWLNHAPNKTGALFGFFMTPREIGKAPSPADLKSLKTWKAWGACFTPSVTTKGQHRQLCVYDPELSQKEANQMQKTGEMTKLQQLLVGAVKRCMGGCEAVVITGRRDEENGEKDSFALTAEWAAERIREGGLGDRGGEGKALLIAK